MPTASKDLTLLAGDVGVSRAPSGLLAPLVSFFEGRPGDPAWATHAWLVTKSGFVDGVRSPQAELVEAVWPRIRKVTVAEAYGPAQGAEQPTIIIYRPLNVPADVRSRIAARAEELVGARYGVQGLVWHLLDSIISRQRGRDTFLFRRLRFLPEQECSEVVARAEAPYGYLFEKPAGVRVSPDDIDDFCKANPDKYARLFGPGRIGIEEGGSL